MATTVAIGDAVVSRSVKALKAWHQLSVVDIAAAMHVAKATAERRLKSGGYSLVEVQTLAAYFGLTTEALETGRFRLPESELTMRYGCNAWLSRNGEALPSSSVAA